MNIRPREHGRLRRSRHHHDSTSRPRLGRLRRRSIRVRLRRGRRSRLAATSGARRRARPAVQDRTIAPEATPIRAGWPGQRRRRGPCRLRPGLVVARASELADPGSPSPVGLGDRCVEWVKARWDRDSPGGWSCPSHPPAWRVLSSVSRGVRGRRGGGALARLKEASAGVLGGAQSGMGAGMG
jgi:hypothetical protein